ncbi:DUF2087 domain-containing protein [Flexivirga caeni]|uniref:DUF2087 domain-containing protein n=1 Tax=Flexivirga caeni TaxID=2294115 RepID=A0A3M9MKF0_9MICO|nr:DUF2087 domain-containing protein [Flexivirga caeni]RNI25363.1 DUF2087 domain-containing protein [Flexivirga caeni]
MPTPLDAIVHREPRLESFVRDGELTRIPRRPAIAATLYAAVAAQLPANLTMSETEVNNLLRPIYPDVSTLRRALVDHGHLLRSADGSRYERSRSVQD